MREQAQVACAYPILWNDRCDYDAALPRLAGYPDQRSPCIDAVYAALAERLDLPVWTFDHHFDVMGSAI
jgi:predicted nucleic acid-binding protein